MRDISNAVSAKVASRVRNAPVLDFVTSEKDSGLEEEAATAHKKRELKSGKVQTADMTVH